MACFSGITWALFTLMVTTAMHAATLGKASIYVAAKPHNTKLKISQCREQLAIQPRCPQRVANKML